MPIEFNITNNGANWCHKPGDIIQCEGHITRNVYSESKTEKIIK